MKTGAGAQVVGPGSTINGKPYKWRFDVEPIELPPQLVEIAERAGKPSEKSAAAGKQLADELDPDWAIEQAEAYVRGLPEIEEGGRNNAAYQTAAKLFDWPLSNAFVHSLMVEWNDTKCSRPLDLEELAGRVDSASRNRQKARGLIGTANGFEPTEIAERQPKQLETEDAEKPKLYYLTLEEARAKVSEPRPKHLVEGVIPARAMIVTYGDSNEGKSFHVMDRDMHIAGGKPWCERKTTQGAVVWVAAEMSEDLWDRIEAVRQHLGLSIDTPFFAVPCPVDLLRPDGDTKPLIELVKTIETKHNAKVVKATIDTLSRALAGGNENAPDDMGALVKHLDAIRYQCDCAVEAIHHCGKDAAKGARGHSLLRAATDTEIEIGQGRIKVTKQRSMAGGDAFSFRLKERHVGLRHDGSIAKSCYVETVKGDKGDKSWQLPLTSEQQRWSDELRAKASDRPFEVETAMVIWGLNKRTTASDRLRSLYGAGHLTQPKKGFYRFVRDGVEKNATIENIEENARDDGLRGVEIQGSFRQQKRASGRLTAVNGSEKHKEINA